MSEVAMEPPPPPPPPGPPPLSTEVLGSVPRVFSRVYSRSVSPEGVPIQENAERVLLRRVDQGESILGSIRARSREPLTRVLDGCTPADVKAITDITVKLSAKEAAAEMKVAKNSEQVAASVAADKALAAVDCVRSVAMRPPSIRTRSNEGHIAQPLIASAAVNKAMSVVGDISSFPRPPGMEPGVYTAGTAAAQAAFDQTALKLATAIKNLCDGMQLLEQKQNASIAELHEYLRSIEEKTMLLQGEQKAVKAAMATAKKAIRTSQHLAGQEMLPLHHEERLQTLETQVASLLRWQESWFVESVTKPKQSSTSVEIDVTQLATSEQSKELHNRVQALERKSDCVRHLCETVNAIGERGEVVALEVRELKGRLPAKSVEVLFEKHVEKISQEISQNLEVQIEMNRMRLEKNIIDLSERLDHMQDMSDSQKRQSWQIGRQVPEVAQKLDQLWEECKYHFSKVKEHDIHFSFFRSSFESHKQQCLGFDDNYSFTRGYSQDLSDTSAVDSSANVIASQNEVGKLTTATQSAPREVVYRSGLMPCSREVPDAAEDA